MRRLLALAVAEPEWVFIRRKNDGPVPGHYGSGMGSRYGGLKQIVPFGPAGELIIDYSIYDSLRAGFNRIVFVIKQSIKSDFHEIIGNRIAEHCDIDYVFQETNSLPDGRLARMGASTLGTGHAT